MRQLIVHTGSIDSTWLADGLVRVGVSGALLDRSVLEAARVGLVVPVGVRGLSGWPSTPAAADCKSVTGYHAHQHNTAKDISSR